jgi:hypothetical protein
MLDNEWRTIWLHSGIAIGIRKATRERVAFLNYGRSGDMPCSGRTEAYGQKYKLIGVALLFITE